MVYAEPRSHGLRLVRHTSMARRPSLLHAHPLDLAVLPSSPQRHSFRHLHNGIPSSGTDTAHFICFFLFSLVSLGAIWFPIHQIRHLFTLKAYAAPAAGIALFAICIGKAHGAGDLIHAKATVGGSTLGWAFVGSATGSIANMATLITNVSGPVLAVL